MRKVAAFTDVESTGLTSNDKVISLGALFFHTEDEITFDYIGHYQIFNKVDRVISVGAQNVHGISPQKLEELSGGKSYTNYIDDVFDLFSGIDILYGHNISFDINKINFTYGRVFRPDIKIVNTMDVAREYLGRRCNLQDFVKVALHLNGLPTNAIEEEFKLLYEEGGYHGALFDAYATARAYMLLENKLWNYPNT